MTKLDDLNDDCLSQILDRLSANDLFKMLGVNKKMRRVADNMIRNKIRAIAFNWHSVCSSCSELGAIREGKVLFLQSLFKNNSVDESSKQAFFSSLFSKCTAVTCLDTFNLYQDKPDSKPMPDGLFLEVVRRCPQIECLKLDQSVVSEDDLDRALELIGPRIVHVFRYNNYMAKFKSPPSTEVRLLETVAKRCPNIKRVDWEMDYVHSNSVLVEVLKLLPDDCWIAFKSNNIEDDVVDELTTWNWSHFNSRVNRLSSLTWINYRCSPPTQTVRGVEFASLKKLDVTCCQKCDDYVVGCLVASQFPQLEEFHFNASHGFTEDNFDAIFQRMKSVKKLTISFTIFESNMVNWFVPCLPGSSINHLRQLEAIEFNISVFKKTWEPADFLEKLDQYVDGIRSLKKLTVGYRDHGYAVWKKPVKEKVVQLKMKQNRVDLALFIKK